jgi:alpha-L-fucosidase
MRLLLRTVAALASAATYASSQSVGDSLIVSWCNASDPLQQFSVSPSDGTIRTGGLCVTNVANATLALSNCVPGDARQAWAVDAALGTISSYGGSICWNAQSDQSYMSDGSDVKLWACAPVNWNDIFLPGLPTPSSILLNFTSASNETFTDLCTASLHVPPVFPTAPVLAWEESEVGCFVHYQMATMAGSQGCGSGAPPNISAWAPTAVDTDTWVDVCKSMTGTRVVYTAKHGCGFLAWRSNVSSYDYGVAQSPYPDLDIVEQVIASAKAGGIGVGFYYSVVSNAYCNVQSGVVQPGPIVPGLQINVTQEQYDMLVVAHLTELWSRTDLTEIWFDGGSIAQIQPALSALLSELQPNVVAFQGEGLTPNPVRWVGTESGLAPHPCWSTCDPSSFGAGSPSSSFWFPAETDFTLQNGDNWFYNSAAGVRSPTELRTMYETSVGSNTALIIDIAPFPNGTVPADQVQAAQTLGDYVRGCYATPIVSSTTVGYNLTLSSPGGQPVAVDRLVTREDQAFGQLIRSYTISATLADGSTQTLVSGGSSVGNKRIDILASPVQVTSVTLTVEAATGTPHIKSFALYSCSALADELDARWERWAEETGYKAPEHPVVPAPDPFARKPWMLRRK